MKEDRLPRLNFLLAVIASVITLQSQTGSSTITGVVADATASPISNAEVVLTNEDSGARFNTRGNDTGSYRFAALLPGIYRLEANAPGFDKLVRTSLTLAVGQVLPVDLTLHIAGN